MFARFHTLTALLSVALHLLDIVVAAGHQHVHATGDACAAACAAHEHSSEHSQGHDHEHGCGGHHHVHSHCHSKPAPCPSLPDSHGSHPASKPHHDCAICQHLALTPALVSPVSPAISATGSEPVLGEIASLLPPLRTVECRSRAPPGSLS